MKELFNLIVSNSKYTKFIYSKIVTNKIMISVFFSLIIIGIVKFNDIWIVFYKPDDLIQCRKYLDRLIILKAEDDGSCSEKSQKVRREMHSVQNAFYGLLKAHKEEIYKPLENSLNRVAGINFIKFCPNIEKKSSS